MKTKRTLSVKKGVLIDTAQSLKEQFGTIHPYLTTVTSIYLNMDEAVAKNNAAKGLIPFPIFKASDSNKAPWLVDVRDLAEYLDNRRINSDYR